MPKALSLSDRQKQVYLKYSGQSGTRSAAYPGISRWKDTSAITPIKERLDATARDQKAFSLAFHVPLFTGQDQVEIFLQGLEREVMHLAHHVDSCVMEQVHLGGGAANALPLASWKQFYENVLSRFTISEEAEWSVDIDPRWADEKILRYLHDIGVGRVCLGVPEGETDLEQLVERARAQGIPFVNFNIRSGLPTEALDRILALSPDRLAWAEVPPTLTEINRCLEAGYQYIGIDHFAKAGDSLAESARKDQLQRNLQGLTTVPTLPLLGFGPSAISMLDDIYVQNPLGTDDWRAMVENHEFQRKSHHLTEDDKIRREVMNQIYCNGTIDKPYTEAFHDVEFDHYFAAELQQLKVLAQDGILTLDTHDVRLTQPLGLLLRSVVATVFDAYEKRV